MRTPVFVAAALLAAATTVSSKDKTPKVSYRDMALNVRDAFNCGVVVEEYRNGKLKGHDDAYQKEKSNFNCDHVEEILNSLNDQDTDAPPSQ